MIRRAGVLLLALAAACGSTGAGPDYEAARRADPVLAGPDGERLAAALRELEAGRSEPARTSLAVFVERRPDVFELRRWLQEAELAVAQERATFLETAGAAEEAPDPLAELRERYRERAEETGAAVDLLLAARLETDLPAALHLIDRALAADPETAWGWYGRAHVAVRSGRWTQAREALARCLELSPRHLPALRLSAWVQAEAGDRASAIGQLESWIALAAGDPTLRPGAVDSARLDLALLLVQEDRAESAEELLLALEDADVDPVRRWTAIAAVREARDEPLAALEACERARAADPDALLPVVQEALLVEREFDDPERALAAWRLALLLAKRERDLGAVLQRTRAEVHIGRLEQRLDAKGAAP